MKTHILSVREPRRSRGFSLVEALATVAIVGIITFLAVPNIVKMRTDAERSAAIARAEAFNLGVAAFIQSKGLDGAAKEWSGLKEDQKYERIAPYLAYAPEKLEDYVSAPYSLDVAGHDLSKVPLQKVGLTDSSTGEGKPISY